MPVLEITRIREPGRTAKTVEEFYYAAHVPNGLRAMTAGMIQQGKILNRFVCLHDTGDRLTIFTLFRDEHARQEWRDHPTMAAVQEQWAGRGWEGETEVIPLNELINVKQWAE